MKTALKILVVLVYVAVFGVLAAFSSGCSSLGKAGVGLAKIFAPEYAATADNLYGLLLDDQILADADLELVLIAGDGRVYRPREDLTPAVRSLEKRWTWDTVPPAYLRRLVGDSGKSKPADLDAYKQKLAAALKSIPSAAMDKE